MKQVENLDKLAEEIYQEGIEKAKKESEAIISEARKKSDKIIKEAELKANEIIKRSEKEAERINSSSISEVSLKTKQIISDLKESIKSVILNENLEKCVREKFKEKDFIGQLILSATEKWSLNEDPEIIINKEHINDLDSYLVKKIKEQLPGMEVRPGKIPGSGFQIKNTNEGYYISYSEEAFIEFLKPYFSDRIQNMLFEP